MSGNLEVRGASNQRMRRLDLGRVRIVGDVDSTMVVDSTSTSDIDGTVLYYDSPIGAPRTVTLTGAGSVQGMFWKIVRSAAASGGSGIDVGPGLKTLAVGQWCEVVSNGTVWALVAFGSL
jgi:hypothetical protein